MEKKADVRALMAHFQANEATSEEAPSASAGCLKQPLHPMWSGQVLHMKRQNSEDPSCGTPVPPKPSFLKNLQSSNSDTAVQEPNKTKALASKFANVQEEANKPFLKHTPSFTQMSESKAQRNKPDVRSTGSESKLVFPKPFVSSIKPNSVKEDSTLSAPVPKISPVQLKPNSSFLKQQVDVKAEVNTNSVNKPSLPINAAAKPSNFRTAQNLFNKEEQPNTGVVNKSPLKATNSIPPAKPHPSKKPSLKKPSPHNNENNPSTPKKNCLPNSLALGPAPAKPNRPPNVNLEIFKKMSKTHSEGPGKTIAPPLPSHPSNHVPLAPPQPPPAVPSLPPRHPGAIIQTEDFYDDIDGLTNAPPPLPPVHPSQMTKGKDENDDEDGEMYEDLDERWETNEQKQDKRKEKEEKENKRLEAEKKEREKKEQEARKKFKLDGPLEVLQKGKARVDSKGNKTDLSLKQGDSLDIIRIHGNPEGKWLGRSQDGSVGYVKITSVDIDFNSLKQHMTGQAHEPEVYYDIEMTHAEHSKIKGGGGAVLPPLPGAGEEIYDDVDSNLDVKFPPSQFSGESDPKGGATDEDIYDDVESQSSAPAPLTTRMDPKKQKKLEKEEREFRKKFKYEGEIKVLHQVTIIQNLTNKKWSSKELPLKAGEKLDVIVPAVENKLICRNEDGKFGFVSTTYVTDDGDIYDDIGADCIYDND